MGERIFVTGAGGCLGGRLVQRLVLGSREVAVEPLVHRLSGAGAMRLARLPVDVHQGSVTDRDRMDELMADCDAVVHCAVGDREATVTGTRTVLAAAEDAGVETFVYICSGSIHGHDFEGVLTEDAPIEPDTEYGEWKADAAAVVDEYRTGGGMQPTSIRPFIVYGPFSEFVRAPVETLKEGAILTDGGHGTVNQIYVDNLVDAVLLALERPAARGEVYLAVDDDPVTWRRYLHTLGEHLEEHPPIDGKTSTEIRLGAGLSYAAANVVPPVRAIARAATSPDVRQATAAEFRRTPWAMGTYARMPEPVRAAVRGAFTDGDPPLFPAAPSNGTVERSWPSERYRKMHRSTGRLSNEKLKAELGWEQQVGFEEAMALIGDWLAYQYMQ